MYPLPPPAYLLPKYHWAPLRLALHFLCQNILPTFCLKNVRNHPNNHLPKHKPLIFHTLIRRVANQIPTTPFPRRNSRLSPWRIKFTSVSGSQNTFFLLCKKHCIPCLAVRLQELSGYLVFIFNIIYFSY